MNIYDLKGQEFLQQNYPGNDGYGQVGAMGDRGDHGHSVHFTSYDLSNVEDRNKVLMLIHAGKELSNNEKYESSIIEYQSNDLIIDRYGEIYNYDGENSLEHFRSLFAPGNPINSLELSLYANDDTLPEYRALQPNPDYADKIYNRKACSPYIYHRHLYSKWVNGVWVELIANMVDGRESAYTYKFAVMLPDGETITKYTTANTCPIYINMRMLDACSTDENLKNAIAYHGIMNSGEYAQNAANAVLDYIRENCIYYVDAISESGEIFRKYNKNE